MNDSLHPRWHDLRRMLTDWLTWLDETQRWVETTASTNRSEKDGQDVDDATSDETVPSDTESETPQPDLFALLATMTALRQDVNLQTRSARQDREQATQTLEQLSGLVAQLEQERQDSAQRLAAQTADYVHVDALLDLHDALSRAERQASRLIATTTATLWDWGAQKRDLDDSAHDGQRDKAQSASNDNAESAGVADAKTESPGWWRRWFGRPDEPDGHIETPVEPLNQPDVERELDAVPILPQMQAEARHMAERLDALATGYGLSVQRLERLLMTCGIEPIACLDQDVNPELMEVVQIVTHDERPPGTVVDEVRRGYLRHNQLYRFAQVVATRSDTPARSLPDCDAIPEDGASAGESGAP